MVHTQIKFVVGLGNPGKDYKQTPHNLGRDLVEMIQKRENYNWKKEKWFEHTESVPSYVRLHSYMNLSGEAVAKLAERFDCTPDKILICCDDFDLPLGRIRIRKKGSAGSHQGLKSVVQHLGSSDFPRLRLGIGPLPDGEDPADFVLRPFAEEQWKAAKQMMEKAFEAVQMIFAQGLEAAMNRFNG